MTTLSAPAPTAARAATVRPALPPRERRRLLLLLLQRRAAAAPAELSRLDGRLVAS